MQDQTESLRQELYLWNRLRHEQDGRELRDYSALGAEELKQKTEEYIRSEIADENEPSDWEGIKAACVFPEESAVPDRYRSRIAGALVGRFAGCVLGVPVEGYSVDRMQQIALRSGTPFPPTEYWKEVENPEAIQYGVNRRSEYSQGHISGVPVDDDITYTVLNLLLLKRYGEAYTVEEVAALWKELVPYACTAEDRALKRLRAGASGKEAAEGNPFVEWIGGAIRADSFGYVCAGDPARAARLVYPEAYLTHRRNGIYGSLFAAASVAAAFTEKTPLDAVKKGAQFVSAKSRLGRDLAWAFSMEGEVSDFRRARALLDGRFCGMDSVHTNNNMCAVVFAIMLGQGDYTRSIAQSVAMGLDNDCNGATVGSIVGANVGIEKIPKAWYQPFGDDVFTYLNGYEKVSLKGMIEDYVLLHEKFLRKNKREKM